MKLPTGYYQLFNFLHIRGLSNKETINLLFFSIRAGINLNEVAEILLLRLSDDQKKQKILQELG